MQSKVLSTPAFMTAAVMGVVLCAGFLMSVSLVHAEEDVEAADATTEVAADTMSTEAKVSDEVRTELTEKIKALQALLKGGKDQMKSERDANKAEFQVKKTEVKEGMKIDRAAFAASLEGLSDEEKRTAITQYISDMKKAIEERKAAYALIKDTKKAEYDANKDAFKSGQAAFRTDMKDMSPEEKLAAVMERITELTDKASSDDSAKVEVEVEVEEEEEEEEEEGEGEDGEGESDDAGESDDSEGDDSTVE